MYDLLSPLNDTAFVLFGAATSWAELLGFATGLASVALAALGRISTFAVGLLNAAFFAVLFVDAELYAAASLQLMFFVLCLHGWWAWITIGREHEGRAITNASATLLLAVVAGIALATLALVPVLHAAGGSAPVVDALGAGMSIGAQVLLNLKKVESWYVWVAVDLLYIPLYVSRELLLTAVVYGAFLAICLVALRSWRAASAGAVVA